MNIERQPQESLVDYHKRLIYGKLVDRTLADADYVELSEKLYGQPYSSDVARRMMYGSRKTLELLDSQQIAAVEDSSVLSDIDEKIIELKRKGRNSLTKEMHSIKLSENGLVRKN